MGWNIQLVIIFTSLAIVVYSMLGGMKAVIWTEAIQGFILIGGALVGDRGNQAGGELVYGRDNLMNDIREAANPITPEQLYNIIVASLDHADMRVNISGREFARIVREV